MPKPAQDPPEYPNSFAHLTAGARLIIARSGIAPGQRLLVAVSGGADSTALLLALAQIAADDDLQLTAAHLDHGLRANSASDAECVARLCSRLDVPLFSEREDVAALRRRRKCSIEEAARAARRRFLRRTSAGCGAAMIALGHTREDLVETVVLNLLRGSGLRGIAAMKAVDPPIVRPLITATHQMTVACCMECSAEWCEDETNQDIRFTRNWLRQIVLPMLRERLGDTVDANIARFGMIAGTEEAAMEQIATDEMAAISSTEEDGAVTLPAERLADLNDAIARRVVRQAIGTVRGSLDQVTFVDVQRALAIARGEVPGAELRWSDGASQMVVLRNGRLCVSPVRAASNVVQREADLRAGDRVYVPTLDLDLALLSPNGGLPPEVHPLLTVKLPVWALPPFRIGTWRAGDRLGSSAGDDSGKVADLLTRAGLKGVARRNAVVIRANNGRCAIVVCLGEHGAPAAISAPGDGSDIHLAVLSPLERPDNHASSVSTRSRVL